MDKATKEKIKKDLLYRRDQIEKELASFVDKSQADISEYISNFPEYGDENDENAQEVSEYSTNLETERILIKSLRDIDKALKKIDAGDYGKCKYCGQDINPKRLLVRPASSACIECKTKLQSRK